MGPADLRGAQIPHHRLVAHHLPRAGCDPGRARRQSHQPVIAEDVMNTIPFQAKPDPAAPILSIEGLSLSYRHANVWKGVVEEVNFTVGAGEVVALVGESGSGKTTTAQA